MGLEQKMTDEQTKLADLPAQWEAEAEEIDTRLGGGEVSGEVWETRRDILTENAIDLRDALYAHIHKENSTDDIPSSVYRLSLWLGTHGYPNPAPETNDVADWALAKLREYEAFLQSLSLELPVRVDKPAESDTIDA